MTLQQLIEMLENRLRWNAEQRAAAEARGDVSTVESLDKDSASTQGTLTVLRAAL